MRHRSPGKLGLGALFVFACLALVSVSVRAAPPRGAVDSRDDAGFEASSGSVPVYFASTSPEPLALQERAQYVVDLRWVRGDVYLVSMVKSTLTEPRETSRVMGRFALELFEGKTLVERVRFDFPLLAAQDTPGAQRLAQKLTTRIGVMFPATPRGTHFELWDRVTDTRWNVPWPPAAIPLAVGDGGPQDASVGPRAR